MRTDAGEHLDKSLRVGSRTFSLLVDRVYKYHHLRDGGIEGELFKVIRNLLDALMVYFIKSRNVTVNDVFGLRKECPNTVQEPSCALDAGVAPRL